MLSGKAAHTYFVVFNLAWPCLEPTIYSTRSEHANPLVATSADSVPSSYLVRITIAHIGTTFGNLQWRRYSNNFTFEYSSNNNVFSFIAMSADSVPLSKTNIFQSKLIYCRHFRTYSRCAMFDWSDTVFRRRNVTRRRISNTVLQPRYWGSEADSPEVCRLHANQYTTDAVWSRKIMVINMLDSDLYRSYWRSTSTTHSGFYFKSDVNCKYIVCHY